MSTVEGPNNSTDLFFLAAPSFSRPLSFCFYFLINANMHQPIHSKRIKIEWFQFDFHSKGGFLLHTTKMRRKLLFTFRCHFFFVFFFLFLPCLSVRCKEFLVMFYSCVDKNVFKYVLNSFALFCCMLL